MRCTSLVHEVCSFVCVFEEEYACLMVACCVSDVVLNWSVGENYLNAYFLPSALFGWLDAFYVLQGNIAGWWSVIDRKLHTSTLL